jgi:hypothetical protein
VVRVEDGEMSEYPGTGADQADLDVAVVGVGCGGEQGGESSHADGGHGRSTIRLVR